MPDLAQMEKDLGALERDQALYDDDNLAARFRALKTLDFLVEAIQIHAHHQPVAASLQRALSLQADLAQRNNALFQKLRTGIQKRRCHAAPVADSARKQLPLPRRRYGLPALGRGSCGRLGRRAVPQRLPATAVGRQRRRDDSLRVDAGERASRAGGSGAADERRPICRHRLRPGPGSASGASADRRRGYRAGGDTGICGAGAPRSGQPGDPRGDVQTGGRPQRRPVRRHGLLSLFPLSGGRCCKPCSYGYAARQTRGS